MQIKRKDSGYRHADLLDYDTGLVTWCRRVNEHLLDADQSPDDLTIYAVAQLAESDVNQLAKYTCVTEEVYGRTPHASTQS